CWPGITAATARVGALVAARLQAPATDAALAELDGAELWLAAACADGDAAALARFDADYLAPLSSSLAHLQLGSFRLAEVQQHVREKLLLRDGDGETTRLEGYAGRGRLAALVGVVATRAALDRLRAQAQAPQPWTEGDDALAARIADDDSPEAVAIAAEHAQALRGAFADAVAALDPEDRGLLRLQLLDGLGIDAIAALHGVHRSTAARWLQSIRDRLGTAVRRALRQRLGPRPRELDSLLRAADSRLELSMSRLLRG
ncbi:MAG: hypothetical protein K1X88_35795, partial [Nannocystaceae bacterium]|nr:hypothetical protein [Nannocystaceae bacterium]